MRKIGRNLSILFRLATEDETRDEKNSWIDVATLVNDRDTLLDHLKKSNLIANKMFCKKCETEMRWTQTKSTTDGFFWKCLKCKSSKSIRNGSYFQKTKISIGNVYSITYLWSLGIQGFIIARMIPELRKETVYDFCNFARDICCQKMEEDPIMFGEEDCIEMEVQIDESIFGKSRKYNRGKAFKQQWVFGISEAKSHKCMLCVVHDRSAETLCKIIEQHVSRSAHITIVSDGWASYNTLKERGYKHSVVIHKEEFVNAEGKHTNSVESVWSQVKNWIKSMHGVKRELLPRYLLEFQYRYNYCGSTRGMAWKNIMKDISQIYKV